jgi:hypothetical protein
MSRLGPLLPALAAATVVSVVAFVSVVAGGCSSKPNSALGGADDPARVGDDSGLVAPLGGDDSGSSGNSSSGFVSTPGTGTPQACPASQGLSCNVSMCKNGKHTTLTGHVYDPAGKNPLYNVIVFVPSDPNPNALPAIETGTKTCNTCNTPVGNYVAATFPGAVRAVALTDQTGAFTLTDVPTGKNVPLVVQVGKWRRTITVANVADCATTAVPESGPGQARLPANQNEGSMPKMALLTGGQDDLGCFMTRMGIASSEYAAPGGTGRLAIYQGLNVGGFNGPALSTGTAGNCTNTSCPLWQNTQSLEAYDIVLLACEGGPMDPDAPGGFGGAGANITKPAKQAMHDWLNEGGKVFATHFHYTWFQYGPPDFQTVATWLGSSIALNVNGTGTIDTSFPKGQQFAQWLKTVGATTGSTIPLLGVGTSVSSVNTMTTQRWIYDNSTSDTKYMSFETPIGGLLTDAGELGGRQYCGKAVFTDLHAGGAPLGDVPGMCKQGDLSAQEKALEFLFFDLSACVTDDSIPPPPPVEPPK